MRLIAGRAAVLACLIGAVASPTSVTAQEWPSRFISLVVPFGPGSGTDIVARIIAAAMSEKLGQQVVVENLGGAGGVVGVSRVAKAAPDGYQIVMGAVDTFAQSQSLFKNPAYNSLSDFTPVALAIEQPLILIVRKEIPAENLKDFAAYVKQNQAKMQYGSAGVGAAPHLACSQLTTAIGADVTHIPYRGSAPALQDLIAGRLDYYCPLAGGAIPLIESKSVKALAILTSERSTLLPSLPTAKEQGYDAIDGYYWMGFFLPKGVPQDIVRKLGASVDAALNAPWVQSRLREVAATPVAADRRSPEYLQAYVGTEIAKWSNILKASGIQPQ